MATTTHFNLQKPDASKDVDEEFYQLQSTLDLLDSILKVLQDAVNAKAASSHTHAISEVVNLATELAAKMPASQTFALDNLTDVDGAAGAPNGYVLVKSALGWLPSSALAALGSHGHLISEITGLVDALAAKLPIDGSAPMNGELDMNGNALRKVSQLTANGYSAGTEAPFIVAVKGNGNDVEFGHPNVNGHRSVLGHAAGSGAPFLALNGEAGSTDNTYRTRGIRAAVIESDNAGGFLFRNVASAAANNQSPTTRMSLDNGGRLLQPFQPRFFAIRVGGAHQTVAGVVEFASEQIDVGGWYNNGAYNAVAPVAGTYIFSVDIFWYLPNANSFANGQFHKNAVSFGPICHSSTISSVLNYQMASCTVMVQLAAGDYVDFRMTAANAGGGVYSSSFSSFKGWLVG